MSPHLPATEPSVLSLRVGRAVSAVVAAILVADAGVGLLAPDLLQADIDLTGFTSGHAGQIGWIVLVCALVYAVPQTAVLGAIMITGFLGGAICAHFRLGEIGSPPQLVCLALGIAAWSGLYLRDPRVRELLPLRVGTSSRPIPVPDVALVRASA